MSGDVCTEQIKVYHRKREMPAANGRGDQQESGNMQIAVRDAAVGAGGLEYDGHWHWPIERG